MRQSESGVLPCTGLSAAENVSANPTLDTLAFCDEAGGAADSADEQRCLWLDQSETWQSLLQYFTSLHLEHRFGALSAKQPGFEQAAFGAAGGDGAWPASVESASVFVPADSGRRLAPFANC